MMPMQMAMTSPGKAMIVSTERLTMARSGPGRQAAASPAAVPMVRGRAVMRKLPGGWLAVFPAYLKLSVDESGAVSAKGYVSVLRSPLPLYELGA